MSKEQGSESAVSRSQFIKEEEMAEEKEAPKKVSRREFVKGAAAVAGAGALASCAPAATPAPGETAAPAPTCPPAAECAPAATLWIPEKWDEEADVVVVGHGFGAMTSAIEADKLGASVLMLEKAPEELQGGNSRVCGQGFIAPSPAIWEDYFIYLKSLTADLGMPVDEDPVMADEHLRFYIEESSKSVEWFEGLGATVLSEQELAATGMYAPERLETGQWIPFYPHKPGADAVASEPGFYKVGGKYLDLGYGMNWYFLEDYIKERPGIREIYETPAKRLVQDPVTKEILGVVAESGGSEIYVKAKRAVSVCNGGWEYNQQMVRDFQSISATYSPGGPYNTGDGIKMCWAVGADIRNMGVITAPSGLSVGIKPPWKSTISVSQKPSAGASITVGANNKRWRDEYRVSTGGIKNKEIAGLEGGFANVFTTIENGVYVRDKYPMPIHIIFDEEARLSGPVFSASFARRIEGFECSADNSAELAAGWITEANSIRELATKIGRDPDALEATVNTWNASCAAGKDLEFDTGDPLHAPYVRKPELLNPIPIEGEPVYAVEAFPSCLNTQGGMRRNTKAQVLDIWGEPIPRLYSAGENGDIWTVSYQCMSNVGGGCYGYGRAAGRNGAAEEPWDEA